MNSALIYLVDDDEDDRFFAKLTFQQHFSDFELICFEDGEHFLEHIRRSQATSMPDMVFLDLNMPRMNGFDTLKALKQIDGWREIPVAVLTTSSEPSDKTKSKQLGACAFLTKPASHELLADTILQGRMECGV